MKPYAALALLAVLGAGGCADAEPRKATPRETLAPEIAETAAPMELAEVFEGSAPVTFEAPPGDFAQDEIAHEMVHWTATDDAEPWQGVRFYSAVRFFEGGPPVEEPEDVAAWLEGNPAVEVQDTRTVDVDGIKATQLDVLGTGRQVMGGHNYDAVPLDGPVRITVWEHATMWWVVEGVPADGFPEGGGEDAYDGFLAGISYD